MNTRINRRQLNRQPTAKTFKVNAFYRESLWIMLRCSILVLSIFLSIIIGSFLFEISANDNTAIQTDDISVSQPVQMDGINTDHSIHLKDILNYQHLRYGIAPLSALILVLFSAAFFVQDVYNLRRFRDALHYVSASMFAFSSSFYPVLSIDDGEKQIPRGKINLLDIIGGPGFLMVQPGNAVFRNFLRKPSGVVINRSVFLEPFENIGAIVNLDDHHEVIEELETMTIDGILVKIKNINFRFRIINKDNKYRSLVDPYPFDEEALTRMGHNVQVNDEGAIPWAARVKMALSTSIREYINANTIDYLTAPGTNEVDTRASFRDEVMKNTRIQSIGAELLWLDVGHLDIIDDNVDEKRIDLWATKWISNADAVRSLGEAKRTAYEDLGKAEARAEILMRITHSLEGIDLTNNTTENLRKLFLMRTALLLESMNDSAAGTTPDEKS